MAPARSFASDKASVLAVDEVSSCLGSRRSVRRSLTSTFVRTSNRSGDAKCGNACALATHREWKSLGVDQSELCLALTLPTGQSFRWKLTGDSEYTGVVDGYLFTLRQTPVDVKYRLYDFCNCSSGPDVALGKTGFSSRACADEAILQGLEDSTSLQLRNEIHSPAEIAQAIETTGTTKKLRKSWNHSTLGETTFTRADHHFCQIHGQGASSLCADCAELSLKRYLHLGTSLKQLWAPFIAADERFASLAPYMRGARLLRQCPLECLFQFICSSNNHIQRISQMVDYLAGLGPYIGNVSGFSFHAFPPLETLAKVTEAELRKASFGYRAKHIVGAVKELQLKKGGGKEWLKALRESTLDIIQDELCSIPGVGPKVAACIALFSLDQHHAIPVDTHVWQIATSYITPELSGERLNSKLHAAVAKAFVEKFGDYAGWAQNMLFISELSSCQYLLPEHLRTLKHKNTKSKSRSKKKLKLQEG